jgi:hypothetical protein
MNRQLENNLEDLDRNLTVNARARESLEKHGGGDEEAFERLSIIGRSEAIIQPQPMTQ